MAYTYKGFHILAEASAMDNYDIDEDGRPTTLFSEMGVDLETNCYKVFIDSGDDLQADTLHGIKEEIESYIDSQAQNADELRQWYSPHDDGEHPRIKRAKWLSEVNAKETDFGYWEWVFIMLQEDN